VSWLLAFVLYKPAAATVYASGFLLIGDVTSPVLVVGAALAGLATVVLVELLD